MEVLVPIALFGWIPFSMAIFQRKKPIDAILIVLIGGVLFLPQARQYNLPVIAYSKVNAISLSLIIGLISSGNKLGVKYTKYDLPVFILCFFSPLLTSLSNGLGLYDGFVTLVSEYLNWMVFYMIGRRYFNDLESINKLCYAIVIGTLIYLPLCLYEIRMSPQLNIDIYGYFQHSFSQHIRYGKYRPIVFMQHGLMVALWMTMGSTFLFWFWKSKKYNHFFHIPIHLLTIAMICTTYLTKSKGSLVFCSIGILFWFLYKKKRSPWLLKILLLIIPLYFFLRISGILSVDYIIMQLSKIFDEYRIESLWFRLYQENLYNNKVAVRPLFGWGGWGRSVPIDTRWGRPISAIDSLWLIYYSRRGLVGLITLYMTFLLGPFLLLFSGRKETRNKIPIEVVLLCFVVIVFMLDGLMNDMNNPVYVLCAGSIISYYIFYFSKDKITP